MQAETTQTGYINKNGQTVLGKTTRPSNHHNQAIYDLKCMHCEKIYGANGSDIWLRKCPHCQNGAASSEG